MTPRREIVLSALLLLAACGAASSGAPDNSTTPPTVGTIAGVGVLPASGVEVLQSTSEAIATTAAAASTTVLAPVGALAESNRVILIGDSLMASASNRYGGQLCDVLVPAGWQAEVDAETSRFIEFAQVVLKARLDAGWNAAVIFLGNNYDGDQIDFAARLNDVVIDLGDIPIVLLTVTEFRPDRARVNEAIRTVAGLHTNVRLVDWASISAADATRILGSDGLHLTDHGRQALADSIGLTLGQAPVQPGKCLSSDFTDDSEGSVTGAPTTTIKGSKKPTSTTVKPTSTTVRPGGATTTTVRSGGSTTTTVRPGGSTTTSPPQTTAPATTVAPTTPPTAPPTSEPSDRATTTT